MQSVELLCGLTYMDVINAACEHRYYEDTARRLGVNQSWLWHVMRRIGGAHWFERKPHKNRPSRISREDIVECAGQGLIIRDAASVLEISYPQMKLRIRQEKLQHLFPNKGKSAAIARIGYCG